MTAHIQKHTQQYRMHIHSRAYTQSQKIAKTNKNIAINYAIVKSW